MSVFLTSVALFLLANLAIGLLRVVGGPTAADRLIATQLFGTIGVAAVLVLAEVSGVPALRDVALVFALLASVMAVAFVKRGWVMRGEEAESQDGGEA
ncbi:MAG TPA: monovalent cation/H+ antiporter complex subunit F [Longimicrobiales bacterium]|nr:monovalent cation/H+ antiporter complex subunit F [Longimicrobiales bacterium]